MQSIKDYFFAISFLHLIIVILKSSFLLYIWTMIFRWGDHYILLTFVIERKPCPKEDSNLFYNAEAAFLLLTVSCHMCVSIIVLYFQSLGKSVWFPTWFIRLEFIKLPTCATHCTKHSMWWIFAFRFLRVCSLGEAGG